MKDFNSFGKINNDSDSNFVSREDKLKSNNINYNDLVAAVGDFLNTKSNTPINYSLTPIANRQSLQDTLNAVDILKNANNYIAFDIETIGSIKDPSTFGITELSVINNNNGDISDLFNLEMGIDKQRVYDIQSLGLNYLNGKQLTQEQMESAYVTSKRIKFNLNNSDNPEVTITNMLKSITDMNNRLDSNGNKVLPFNSKELTPKIQEVWNTFNNAINNNVPIVGHNIKNADIPWINWLFQQQGLDQLDFNKGTLIDTFDLVKGLNSDLFDMYADIDMTNVKGMMRLENIAKMMGLEQNAHIASSDVRVNLEMLNKPINGSSILDKVQLNMENSLNGISISNDSNTVLFSKKAIPNINKSLDVMINDFGTPSPYMNYITTGGVFYNLNNITYTPIDQLSEETRKFIDNDIKGLYSMEISQYGDNTENKTIISKSSLQELSDTIGDYFDVYNIDEKPGYKTVTPQFALRQTEINNKDYARRKFSEMFEGDTNSGYWNAKKMYTSYNEALKTIPNLNKDNLEQYLYNKEVFPNFTSPQQYRDFKNMFQTIADTTNTVTPVLNEIEDKINFSSVNIPSIDKITKSLMLNNENITEEEATKLAKKKRIDILNERKNKALSNYWNGINDFIEENTGIVPSMNMKTINDSLSYINNASININGEYQNINITSKDNAIKNLRRIIYGGNNFEGSQLNNYNLKNLVINNIIRDLQDRGIVKDEVADSIIKSNDVANSINKIGDVLYTTRSNKIEEYGSAESYISNMMLDESKLNLKEIREFNDGFTVNGMSLDKYLDTNLKDILSDYTNTVNPSIDNFYNNIINNSINNSLNNFNIFTTSMNKLENGYLSDDYKNIVANISDVLRNQLNYSEEEISSVADRILGYNSSYINRGYSVQLAQYTNNLNEQQYGIVAYKPEFSNSVNRDLLAGREPSKALIQPLPKKSTFLNGNIEAIKTGDVNSLNTYMLNSYIDKDGVIKFTLDDTITSSIRKGVMSYNSVDELYDIGNYEKAKNMILREYRKPIIEAPGASSFQTIFDNNIVKKGYIPSLADTQKITDLGNITTLLGNLWKNDEEYRNLVIDKIGKEDAEKVHNLIFKNLKDRKITNFHDLMAYNPAFGEYLATNMIRGDDILQRIIDSQVFPEKIELFLKQVHDSNASQILMPSKYKSLDFSLTRPEDLVTYGHLNPLRRPQINQDAASIMMFNDELMYNALKYGIKDLNEYSEQFKNANIGIHFGDIVRTSVAQDLYFSNTEDYYTHGGVNNGVMAGMKQISTKDLENQLNKFDVEKFVKEYNSTHENKTSVKRVEELLHQYKSLGLTNEQHSYVNPILDRMYSFKDELKRINIDTSLIKDFNVGDYIDNDTLIGNKTFNGELKDVYYQGPIGTISYIDKETGKAYVKPNNPAFEQKKYILGGTEKTVGSSIWHLQNGEEAYEEGVELFGSLFGKGTGIAGYYEFGKHESGSAIIGSPLNIITSAMRNAPDEAKMELLNTYNKNMKGYNARFIDDKLNKAGNVLIIDNPKVNSNDIENVKNLIKDIKVLSNNGIHASTRETAKSILDTINYYNDNNLLYLQIKKSALSEMMSTANESYGRGMAISSRTEQVLGATYMPNTLKINNNGELENIAAPIKQYHMDQLKSSKTYQNGQRDLFNIIEANRLEAGLSPKNINGIREVNLEDIALPKGDILTADVLADTVFNNYEGYSVLKVNLGDKYITNPYIKRQLDLKYGGTERLNPQKARQVYREAKQNYLYIPITSPLTISDDELYYSDTLNKSADLIKLLQRKDEISIYEEYGTLDNLNNIINKKVESLYSTLDKEINNKRGIMEKSLLSGRVKYSSNTLNTGIIQYNFTDENRNRIQNIHSDDLITMIDGKPYYNDIAYTSKEMFKDIGIEDKSFAKYILNDKTSLDKIKDDLLTLNVINDNGKINIMNKQTFLNNLDYSELGAEPEKGYSRYRDFKNTEEYISLPQKPKREDYSSSLEYKTQKEIWSDQIEEINKINKSNYITYKNEELAKSKKYDNWVSKKILFENNKYEQYIEERMAAINELVTNTYLERVGVPGLVLRHPAFHSGSSNAVMYKLNQDMTGKSVLLTEAIGKKLNADTDGDQIMIEMFLRNEHGHNVIMKENDNVIKAHNDLLKMQQKFNQEYFSNKPIDEDVGLKFDISIEGFEANLKKIHGENALEHVNTHLDDVAYSVGIKARIDKKFIGYISNINKKIRDSLLEEAEYRLNNGIEDISDLKSIAEFTNQAEQKIIDVKHDSAGKLTTAGKYSEALNEMINANGDKEKLDKAFNKLYYATTNSAMFGDDELPTVEQIISGKYEPNENADELRNLYRYFENKRNTRSFNDPLNSGGYISNIDTSLKILNSIEEGSESYIGNQKRNIIQDSFKYTPTDEIYYRNDITGTNDVINVKNIEKTDLGYKATIYDKINDKTSNIYKQSYEEILDEIKNNYVSNMKDTNEYMQNLNKEYRQIFKENNLLNPSNTEKTLTAVEYFKNYDLNSDSEVIRDNINKIIKDNSFNTTVDDVYQSIRSVNENTKSLYSSIKGLTNEEKDLYRKGAEVFNNMVEQNTITESLAKRGMQRINREIIEKAKVAKLTNEDKRRRFKEIIQDTVNEAVTGSYNLDNININSINNINNINKELLNYDLEEKDINTIRNQFINENRDIAIKNTEEFNKAYNTPGGKSKILNWNDNLGEGKVGFGEYADLSLNEISINDLYDILNNKDYNEYKDMIAESKNRINNYINEINYSSEANKAKTISLETNVSKISKQLNSEDLRNMINQEIIDKAKKSKASREAGEQTIKESLNSRNKTLTKDISESLSKDHEWYKNKYFVGASIVAGILGLTTALGYGKKIMDEQAINVANDNRKEENSEDYEEVSPGVKELIQQAPPSENTGRTILDGVKMRITGKNVNNVNKNDIIQSIGASISNSTNTNVNINTTEKDDRQEISDSWLKKQFRKIL